MVFLWAPFCSAHSVCVWLLCVVVVEAFRSFCSGGGELCLAAAASIVVVLFASCCGCFVCD